jgi:hypothetical protein
VAAFTLSSETNNTLSSLRGLFDFLSDFKNFKSILPADKVENFQYSGSQCSFSIKGITPMTVTLAEKNPYEIILFKSDGLGKFNFELRVVFTGKADVPGQCRVDLSGDLNPYILAMARGALQQLINTMAMKLSQLKQEELTVG